MGSGPGLVLLHGAMQTSQSFTKLAVALSDAFTVYVPDRRGRGLSGPFGDNYGMAKEVDDLAGLLDRTGVNKVFGLSSGALIALQAALILPSIRQIGLYEPPLLIDGAPSPILWVPHYEKEISRGDLAAAMVANMKGTGDRSLFTALPRFILVSLMRWAIRASVREAGGENRSLETLIPTVNFDAQLAAEMGGPIERFETVRANVLLIGGTRSVAYLPAALNALNAVLPNTSRVTLSGVGHLAADDTGMPQLVANELRGFFSRDAHRMGE